MCPLSHGAVPPATCPLPTVTECRHARPGPPAGRLLARATAVFTKRYTSLGFPDPRKLPYTPSATATHPVLQASRGCDCDP
jgi:hypothetical protein